MAMGLEINLDSIRALEKQIEEHERAIIRLKRTRNSLLNVSTLLPPEVLGNIFGWNIIPCEGFGGLPKGSYNFLLVCHHWFEVASRTPGLWRFWGTTIGQWTRRYARCKTGPLDLVLEGCTGLKLDDELRDALQDRAARDTIRRIHLRGFHKVELLNSVISIITEGKGTRSNSVESFIVQSSGVDTIVDVSSFFSRYHLPKLQCLFLNGCRISSWDLVESRTTALTTLELGSDTLSPVPTLSQLLSILSSNPLLQDLALSYTPPPHVANGERSSSVPLPHLKKLRLLSDFRHAFSLLNQLELPDRMDSIKLSLYECPPSDLLQTLGPYLGDRVRRRGRFPGGGLVLWTNHSPYNFRICTGDAHRRDDSAGVAQFMTVDVDISETLGEEEAEKLGFELTTYIPRDEVGDLRTTLPILRSEELCVEMCNLKDLSLVGVDLSTLFTEPEGHGPHASENFLRGLDSIRIIRPVLSGGDWSPVTNFLSHRAAIGNRISSLRFNDCPWMDDDEVERIECVVEDFAYEGSWYEDSDDDY